MESLPPLPPGAVLDDSPSSLPPLPHGAMLDPPRAPDAPSLPSLPAGASLDPPPPPGATLDPPHPTPAPAPASTHGVGAPHPAPGNETLNVQPPGEPPIFLQEAYREIAKTPGLGKAGQLAVIGKHQARAFGPPPTPAEYAPTVSNPGVADKAVQAVNQFEKGYVLNKALPVMRRIPGLEDTANRTEKFYNENYSSEPSDLNTFAEGTGDVASTIGLAGGPAASVRYATPIVAAQGAVGSYDAARQQGASVGPALAQGAVGGAVSAIPFPVARYGGAALSKALPAAVAETAAGRIAAAVPALYAEQVGVGAGQALAENAIAGASYDPQRNPYEGIDRNLLIRSAPGAIGFGLAAARKPGEQQRSQPTEQPRQPVEAPTEPAQPQQNQPSHELLTRAPEAPPHEQSLPVTEKGTPDAPTLRTDQESPRAEDADGGRAIERSRDLQLQPQRQEEPGNAQQRVEAPGEVPAAQEEVKAPAPAEGQEATAVQQPEQEAQAEGVAPATPEAPAEAAPPTGVFDRMENWARERLKEVEQRATENTAGMTAEQHKRLGSAGPLDPHRLVLYGVIGAAKIAKGAQRFVTWSKAMAEDLGEKFTGMRKVDQAYTWREARRIHRMSDADRADYVAEKYTVPQSETTKQTVRRLTGQVDTARATAEVEALHAKLRAAAQGAKEGYRAGVADLAAIKKDFAKTIRETLPPALHGDFLGEVSRVRTPGQMRVALTKASNLLADYELRGALGDVEKLTGTLKLDLPKAIRTPEVTEAQAAELAGAKKVEALKTKATGEDLRSIDLNTLAEPYRGEVRKLIGEAKGLKLRMQEIAQKGGTAEEKGRMVDDFERIDRAIRQQAADERATKELRVGKRIINRDSLVNEVVGKIDPKGEAAAVKPLTSEPSREVSLTRRIARAHASMETVATNILGRDSEAYKATIDNVRRGQEGYHDERRRFHQHMSKAFEAAGIEPGSKKLNDWLNTRETVELPGGRLATLTRNEMVGLMASYGDPQTAALVDRGVKWTSRNNPRDAGFKLSPGDFAAINARLSDGERSLIDAFKSYNSKEITARAMATKLDLSGWAPDPHEGYYPRARNRKQLEDAGLPEGWRGMRRRALENVSSMKERAPDLATPLFVPEFLQDTSRYVDDTARLLHLAEPVRTVASLWEHPKVAQAVQHKYGESMNRRVQRFLEDTMQVQVKPPDNGPGKITAALARNVSRAWLQLNPSPVAKNVIGGTISLLPEFDAPDLAAGVGKMFSRKTYHEMVNGSGVAWDRYEGQGLYGQHSPLTEKRVESVARMTLPEAVKAMKPGAAVDALPFMRWADSVPLRVAWEASKHWAERTMPEATPEARRQEALDKFHDSIYRTQNGSSSTEIADAGSLARRQPWLQPFLMFQSDNLKKANLLMQMRSADAKTRSKVLAAVALNALAGGGIGWALKSGAVAAGQAVAGAPPNPDEREKINNAFWWDSARGITGLSPLGNVITDIARSFGRPNPSVSISNPVTEAAGDFLTSFVRAIQAATKFAETDADTPERQKAYDRMLQGAERLLMGAGTLAGVPLVPPVKLVRRGIAAGNYKPEDPRLKQNREETKARTNFSKQLRQQTPNLRNLLDERNELDRKGGLGDKNLTPAERERKFYLDGASRVYDRHLQAIQKAKAASDTGAVDRLKDSLRRAVSDPDRLDVEREMTALRAKRTAAAEARKEKRLSDAYRAFNGTDQYRLNRLENAEKMIHQTEDKLGKGEITPQEAERRTRSLVGSVKKKAS